MGEEVWKEVPGFDGRYEASSLGHIRTRDGRILPGSPDHGGYLRVSIKATDGDHQLKRSVHSLVLQAFRGERPDGYHGAHLDGDRQNNQLKNLVWVSRRENERHKRAHGTNRNGSKISSAKLDPSKVREIRRLYERQSRSNGLPALAARLGVNVTTIRDVVLGRTWAQELSTPQPSSQPNGEADV